MDERNRPGQFLLLGSASPELLRQSSESLAGRVRFLKLSTFVWPEIAGMGRNGLTKHWVRGGFPPSLRAATDGESHDWRLDYISALLERDLPQFGFRIPPESLRRFWRMIAHYQGDLLNLSKIGSSLGASHTALHGHMDALIRLFMIHELQPEEANLKKRLVKTPKAYVRDTGILHALLDIRTHDDLLSHPVFGHSWEGYVVEHVRALLPRWGRSFYRTSNGAELDIVLELGRRRVAIECKASSTPEVTRGFWTALQDLSIKEAWVVAPFSESYPIGKGVRVAPLNEILATLAEKNRRMPYSTPHNSPAPASAR